MTDFLGVYTESVFHWGASQRFVFAPLFIVAIVALAINFKQIKRFLISLSTDNLHRNRLLKTIAYSFGLFFIFIALMQPQWHKKPQTVEQEGRDLLVLLDISRSMLAQDLKPNRLEFMKLKIKALLQKLPFERVGLILFSGSAFIQSPLTVDYSTFNMFLDDVDVENISSGTTAIDSAIEKAIELYQEYPNRKNKLTLLVTDGEDFSLNLNTIQEKAKSEGIKIFALGAGTPDGAPIPKANRNGYETDESGNTLLSKLNEPLLKNICKKLDGNYIKTRYNDSDLDKIASLIHKFEKEKFGDKKLSLYEDQYPWFLGASWLLFALEWIL